MTLNACWRNGQPIQQLSPLERGLAYGDGVFTTMAVRQGRAELLAYHWQRLEHGCQRLAINTPNFSQWQDDFRRFLICYPDVTAKIIISRGEGGRGYLPDLLAQPNCYFYAFPVVSYPESYQQAISTDFLRGRLGVSPLLAGIKHLNRLEQVLLRQELAQTSYPEALVCDVTGKVIEGVFSNVFMVKNQQLLTPYVNEAGVAGVMRRYILQLAAELGIIAHEKNLMPADFLAADEVFFCNSLYGIWPVAQIAGTMLPSHRLTQKLQSQLEQRLSYV